MEQQAVVRFFTLKGLSPRDIYTELESVYMDETLCLHTVYKRHERFMQGRMELFDDPRSGRSLQNDLADALRPTIQEFPFTLCKSLCIHFRLGTDTCLHILHDVLRLQKFNLRWVTHFLGDAQRAKRVLFSIDLLRVLQENKKTDFANIMTDDEPWFYFEYPHQSVWVSSRDEVPERIKQRIDTKSA
jgi:transposase